MKRRFNRPIILAFPYFEVKPRILPFPRDGKLSAASESQPLAPAPRDAEVELRKVRDRLFRMIVATQWNPSHGNRAS